MRQTAPAQKRGCDEVERACFKKKEKVKCKGGQRVAAADPLDVPAYRRLKIRDVSESSALGSWYMLII